MLDHGIPSPGPDARTDPRELRLVERLGEGSYGVVFRARDPSSGTELAVKALRDTDPGAIARFKREFRALADLHHPNLVTLHQLSSDGDRWMFSMELVPGVDLMSWVTFGPQAFAPEDARVAAPPRARHGRLRETLWQVVEGLGALHAAGHLHRDLKPSNVLVTREGRVVVLDFGLVDELRPGDRARIVDPAGSPAYMSPEQSAGAPSGESSDWYGLGVVIFECLTGQLPFDGPSHTLLHRKQTEDPPEVRALAPGAPDDLADLCMELLRRRADRRPGLEAIRHRLRSSGSVLPGPGGDPSAFGGRDREMATLEGALQELRSDPRPRVVCLRGPSGMGKSALLQRFTRRVEGSRTVVLTGRCFHQEAVPYKGLDGVIDALAHYLRTLGEDEVRRVLPDEVGLVARLFPVLAQVPAVAAARLAVARPPDPQQLRESAFEGLRELLRRITARRPIVVAVDDAQWGDADSADLLRRLLSGEQPPSILWLIAHRDDRSQGAPMIRACLDFAAAGKDVRDLRLGPLDPRDARKVVHARLGDAASDELAERIVEEASGVPLFLTQLVAHAGATGGATGVSLADTLRARLATFSERATQLLRAVCVFGRPVVPRLAWLAAGAGAPDPGMVAELRATRLLRTMQDGEGITRIEAYHDRVREVVIDTLSDGERRDLHAAWSAVLRAQPSPDPELLAPHLEGAGDRVGAAHAFGQAADRAVEAFAWDRAAHLFAKAAALWPTAHDAVRWRRGRAQALANAGRGAEAARIFEALAAGTGEPSRVELQRLAAEQWLRAGRMDEGFERLRRVLAAYGLPFPPGPATALAGLAHQRALLRLRRDTPRRAPESRGREPSRLRRIDACLSASVGMGGVDSVRGAYFHSQALRLALDAGDPQRLAHALAFEAAFQSNRGAAGRQRAEALIARAAEVANRLDDPYLAALLDAARAVASFHVGEWERCGVQSERAVRALRERCVGVAKEVVTIRLFSLAALAQRGRYDLLGERVDAWLEDARRRGDAFAATNLRTGLPNLVWLARDDPSEAERQANGAMEEWHARGFLVPHFFDLLARTELDLYRGQPRQALLRLERTRWPLRRSLLQVLQVVRVLHRDAWGRACLARGTPEDLARAGALGRRLARENVEWACALGHRILGQVAAARGRAPAARRHLEAAATGFTAAGMDAHAATARWGLLELAPSAERTNAERERERLGGLGVRASERFLRLHLPVAGAGPQTAIEGAP